MSKKDIVLAAAGRAKNVEFKSFLEKLASKLKS